MPRRVSLPGASELFRNTGTATDLEHGRRDEPRIADPQQTGDDPAGFESRAPVESRARPGEPLTVVPDDLDQPSRSAGSAEPTERRSRRSAPDQGSGRVRHDEKITVYVSSDELIALEEARLRLRAEHGMAVDRGRIVRQAISAAMADFAANGASSELIRKLSAS